MDWGIPISNELIICCMRISVAVCFLATGADKIVEPDVLNRHRERFDRANPEERNNLHAKAKQRGKHGWTIGRFERETLIPRRSSSGGNLGTGQELEFQHQRSAHFHVVRYGPAKSLSKVEFYRQITVRPDLDPSPITKKGYKTRA